MVPKRHLSKRIQDITGLTIPEFCQKYLFTNYKAFQYRIRVGRCNPNEIIFISWFLGESVESLFGKPFTELMISHGDNQVSEKALDLLDKASKAEKKRLMGLLGSGFSLGVPTPEIGAGVSSIDGAVLPPVLPMPADWLPTVDVKARYKAVSKTQKKASIPTKKVEDMTPKDFDPFSQFEDFSLIR